MRRSKPWVPLLLAVLALYDLRVDLELLLDHFTWSTFLSGIAAHPLAVAVLVLTPAQLRK